MINHIRPLFLMALVISLSSIGVLGSQGPDRSKPGDRTASLKTTTPPYHKSAKEAKPLPRILPASNFGDRPIIARAYEIASEIPFVLAQQPCYCNCDKAFGHSSLLDCYASSHTAGCGICLKETFFAFEMTKQRKKPREVRDAIIRGDWKTLDLNQIK